MKRFKKIYIEITNVCNLNCEFCPPTQREASFMDISSFEEIVSKITDYTDFIYLHVKGEPLLHPQLGGFLELAYKYGLKVNITTNGTLINKAKNIILNKPSLRQINFSLHSFEANDLDSSFEVYLNNILEFTLEALNNTNIIISYRLWNLDKDAKSMEKNMHIIKLLEKAFNQNIEFEEGLLKNRGFKLADRVYLNPASRFLWPDKKLELSDESGFCLGLKDQIAILSDGTVVPCCLDGEGVVNLGNVYMENFEDIINSNRAKKIAEGFANRKITEELCKKCDYRRRFGK